MMIQVGLVLGRNARSLLGLGVAALLLVECGRSGLLDYEYDEAGVPEVDGGSTDGEVYDGTVYHFGSVRRVGPGMSQVRAGGRVQGGVLPPAGQLRRVELPWLLRRAELLRERRCRRGLRFQRTAMHPLRANRGDRPVHRQRGRERRHLHRPAMWTSDVQRLLPQRNMYVGFL